MLRVLARETTCARHVIQRCTLTQALRSNCRRQQSGGVSVLGPDSHFVLPPHTSTRIVSNRNRRQVIRNAGGPAGGITRSKNSKGKEVSISPCMLREMVLAAWRTTLQLVFNCALMAGFLMTHIAVQVDTPGKKLLVGVAIGYLALVLLVPTVNVFVQVTACPIHAVHAKLEMVKLNVTPPHGVNLNIHPAVLQAFARGVGPFISNITEPDFLQAVSLVAIHIANLIIIMVHATHACIYDTAK